MRVGSILDLMRIGRGVFLNPFSRHPIGDEVERLAKAGARHVEFTTDLLFSNVKAQKVFAGEKERLVGILKSLDLTCSFHLPTAGGFCTGSPWKEVREGSVLWLKEFVELSKPLAPTGYVMHPQALMDLFRIDLGHKRDGFVTVRQVQKYFVKNIIIPNENFALAEIRRFMDPARIFLENSEATDFYLLEKFALESGYSVCMDVGHLYDQGESVEDFIRKFQKVLRHVHLHDVISEVAPDSEWRRRDHHPLGTGIVDIPRTLQGLRGIGFEGVLVIEDYFEDPVDSVRYLVRLLQK